MDDVGSTTLIMVAIALLVGLVSTLLGRGWLIAWVLAALASLAFFYVEFAPARAEEMLLPLVYSAVPALLGAVAGNLLRKRKLS